MMEHVKNSIKRADLLKSKLTAEIMELDGMCQGRVRHLLNNVVNMPGARYLEIGIFKGATFVSALYNNNYDTAIAIDNWSEVGDFSEEFKKKCDTYIGKYKLFNADCFNVKLEDEINIYFYDGNHLKESQARALSHFYDSLANEIIYIVDDYNWAQVRIGTQQAIKDWTVLYEACLGGASNHWSGKDWGAGIYIAVLRK